MTVVAASGVPADVARPRGPGLRLRIAAGIVVLPLLFAGCAANQGGSSNTSTANLTPAQAQLRQVNSNWNTTVATGALAGAAVGAGIGTAVSRDRGTGALIGGTIGAVLGAGLGTMVGNRNYTFANQDATNQQRAQSANATADALEQQAQSARQVVEQNRRALADLDRQYRARQITAADYNQRIDGMRADLAAMRQGVENGKEARDELNRVSSRDPALRAAEDRIRPAQRQLEGAANELDELLRRAPSV